MNPKDKKQIKTAFGRTALLRSRDLQLAGISRALLRDAAGAGIIEKVERGLYRMPGFRASGQHSLALAAKRVPQGVVCLSSALRFHDLTTQNPHEVWMAIPGKAWHPQIGQQPLRFVWLYGAAFGSGIETHQIDGADVKVYSVAKTVADCFKYRNKFGLDVALEALREAWRERRCTMDELVRCAKICRVANIMRPYLESLA